MEVFDRSFNIIRNDRCINCQIKLIMSLVSKGSDNFNLGCVMQSCCLSCQNHNAFLNLLPSHRSEIFSGEGNFSFVWLTNPVLLVIIAQKP